MKIPGKENTLGERLTWARRSAGYAKRAEFCRATGIHPGTYRTWEADEREPDNDTIERLAHRLNVAWAWLARGVGKPKGGVVDLSAIHDRVAELPDEKRDDAIAAMVGMLDGIIARK